MSECISPYTIEPWQLEAYVDGARDPVVVQHLTRCAACRQQIARYEQEEAQLSTGLFRLSCPEPGELLNYEWGLLNEKQSLSIGVHLAECIHCRQEASQLAFPHTLPLTDADDNGSPRLRLLVARLLPQNMMPAGVRSAETEAQLAARGRPPTTKIYVVDELGWDITLTIWPEKGGTFTVQGQLLGVAADQVESFKASLSGEKTTIAEASLNEVGVFKLSAVSPGNYTLSFETSQVKVYIPDVTIG